MNRLSGSVERPVGEEVGLSTWFVIDCGGEIAVVVQSCQQRPVISPPDGVIEKVVAVILDPVNSQPFPVGGNPRCFREAGVAPVAGLLVEYNLCIGHRFTGHPIHHEEVMEIFTCHAAENRQIGEGKKVGRLFTVVRLRL